MEIVVVATDPQWEELINCSNKVDWVRASDQTTLSQYGSVAALFNLSRSSISPDYGFFKGPVFINAVTETLHSSGAGSNIFRINAWPGFLYRNIWEIAGLPNDESKKILTELNKEAVMTADEPGLISARIIAMIINEAYYAVDDEVSSRKDIDTAMKLGTKYPYGPFEWADLIGIDEIYRLLQVLAHTDKRYLPAPLLTLEASKWKL